jgi:predicted nuclease of predicted toxin-antitoxin system
MRLKLRVKKKSTQCQSLEPDFLKFLIDECTGIWVSLKLKQMGFDSVSVIDCMPGASDGEIIKTALEENRVIITNDKYFGRLAEFHKLPGMILLRLKDESVENKVKVVSFIVSSHLDAILGNIMVASEKKIRVQRMRKS